MKKKPAKPARKGVRPATPDEIALLREAPEGLEHPTAEVEITEVAPNADQIEQLIKDEPARLPGFVRQSLKQSARLIEAKPLFRAAEKRAAAVGPRNEQTKQNAKADYQKIREVARELRRPRRKQLQAELSKRGLSVSIKTISRALNPKK
jgi:DNA-binding PucR family transcriptional regulator